MSTDWNVHCVTCNSTHTFCDANHRDAEMLLLCKHAKAIAAMDALRGTVSMKLWEQDHWRIDTEWFAQHAEHKLVPIDEYGRLLTQCNEHVACPACGVKSTRCTLDLDHEGECR